VVGGWCDVNSEVLRESEEGPCGAVFFVLTRGSEAAPWQWDGRELLQGTRKIADLTDLARAMLEMPREHDGNRSES
jgi:hypothetical protein